MVTVTEDPDDATAAVAPHRSGQSVQGRLELPVLFFGHPSALAPEVRAQVALVTTSDAPASDLTVLVDAHRALRFTRWPARCARTWSAPTPAAQLDELVAPVPTWEEPDRSRPAGARPRAGPGGSGACGRRAPPRTPSPRSTPACSSPARWRSSSWTVTPRIDGLREALPPNRERRATELVAYLALHRPDTVTSDRLRTRDARLGRCRLPRPRHCSTPPPPPARPWGRRAGRTTPSRRGPAPGSTGWPMPVDHRCAADGPG